MERIERALVTPSRDDRLLLPMRAGLGPGLSAGAFMLAVLLIATLYRGAPLTEPLRLIASTIIGARAMDGGAGSVLLGALLHFGVASLLGMLFTRFVGLTNRSRAIAIALLFALAVWALAQFILLPIVNPLFSLRFGVVWPFFLGHLAYGLFLGATVPVIDEGRWDTSWSSRQGRENRLRP